MTAGTGCRPCWAPTGGTGRTCARELPALAAAWLPDDPGDLIGPGIAMDETAQLKKGDATACVAPQHAGCTGKVENCVTSVFSAYVTASGQAWADFDVYMPKRWADDLARRRAAGIPRTSRFATKPGAGGRPAEAAHRGRAAGPVGRLRRGVWPQRGPAQGMRETPSGLRGHHPLRLPGHPAVGRGDPRRCGRQGRGFFERRSCGTGTKGPRYSDWAMTATAVPGQYLLIRRLISRPDQ